MKKHKINKLNLFIFILTVYVVACLAFDCDVFAIFEYIKSQKYNFDYFYASDKFLTILTFFLLYVFFATVSLPGAVVLMIVTGSLFGFFIGSSIALFATAFGATFVLLLSRFFVSKVLKNKASFKIYMRFKEGIEVYGAAPYLFSVRVIRVFPFSFVNIFMGLMPIKISTFFFTTLVGILLRTTIYVFFGSQIVKIDSWSKFLLPEIIFSVFLILCLPIFSRRLANFVQNYPKTKYKIFFQKLFNKKNIC